MPQRMGLLKDPGERRVLLLKGRANKKRTVVQKPGSVSEAGGEESTRMLRPVEGSGRMGLRRFLGFSYKTSYKKS